MTDRELAPVPVGATEPTRAAVDAAVEGMCRWRWVRRETGLHVPRPLRGHLGYRTREPWLERRPDGERATVYGFDADDRPVYVAQYVGDRRFLHELCAGGVWWQWADEGYPPALVHCSWTEERDGRVLAYHHRVFDRRHTESSSFDERYGYDESGRVCRIDGVWEDGEQTLHVVYDRDGEVARIGTDAEPDGWYARPVRRGDPADLRRALRDRVVDVVVRAVRARDERVWCAVVAAAGAHAPDVSVVTDADREAWLATPYEERALEQLWHPLTRGGACWSCDDWDDQDPDEIERLTEAVIDRWRIDGADPEEALLELLRDVAERTRDQLRADGTVGEAFFVVATDEDAASLDGAVEAAAGTTRAQALRAAGYLREHPRLPRHGRILLAFTAGTRVLSIRRRHGVLAVVTQWTQDRSWVSSSLGANGWAAHGDPDGDWTVGGHVPSPMLATPIVVTNGETRFPTTCRDGLYVAAVDAAAVTAGVPLTLVARDDGQVVLELDLLVGDEWFGQEAGRFSPPSATG